MQDGDIQRVEIGIFAATFLCCWAGTAFLPLPFLFLPYILAFYTPVLAAEAFVTGPAALLPWMLWPFSLWAAWAHLKWCIEVAARIAHKVVGAWLRRRNERCTDGEPPGPRCAVSAAPPGMAV